MSAPAKQLTSVPNRATRRRAVRSKTNLPTTLPGPFSVDAINLLHQALNTITINPNIPDAESALHRVSAIRKEVNTAFETAGYALNPATGEWGAPLPLPKE